MEETLNLNVEYLRVNIRIIIDFVNKIITIEINNNKYKMKYDRSIL